MPRSWEYKILRKIDSSKEKEYIEVLTLRRFLENLYFDIKEEFYDIPIDNDLRVDILNFYDIPTDDDLRVDMSSFYDKESMEYNQLYNKLEKFYFDLKKVLIAIEEGKKKKDIEKEIEKEILDINLDIKKELSKSKLESESESESESELEKIEKILELLNEVKNNLEDRLYGSEGKKIMKKGEKLELFKTILLNKVLKGKFVVIRSSIYDDLFNGVDNLILDKEGNVVCAFDEVCSSEDDEKTKEKMNKILRINENGGALIEYGVLIKGKEIIKERIERVPIFYLSLEENKLTEGIKNLDISSPKKISEKEKEIWDIFVKSLNSQAEDILNRGSVSNEIKSKIKNFIDIISNTKK